MTYSHTQKGHLDTILIAAGLAVLALALLLHANPITFYGLVFLAAVVYAVGLAFGRLTIEDKGDHLLLRYGPLPVFRKRIAYDAITGVRRSTSHLIDGWGIHYVPWRGWTYNVWGFDCVELQLGKRRLRIGTDDPNRLLAAIQEKIGSSPSDS